MHQYRTHTCGQLRVEHAGEVVRLSGWVHRTRDHGNLMFIDLRDHYGITQCVVDNSRPVFASVETLSNESVITDQGPVARRTDDTINATIPITTISLPPRPNIARSPA